MTNAPELTQATTVEQAAQAKGEIRAGGTDVQDRRRHQVSSGPIVDIHRLPGLSAIDWDERGAARIGTLTTLRTIASDSQLRDAYPGLAQAAGGLATPQIRAMASLGGSLLQRSRCWYARHPEFRCYQRGGQRCFAREGQHEHGVVFDTSPCVHPHPSTMGMALIGYEALVEVNGAQWRTMEQLYGDGSDPTRDHRLEQGELLTTVQLPPPVAGERAAYFRAIQRREAEWAIVEAMTRLCVQDGVITFARVTVGAVARVPRRLGHVEAALVGQPPTAVTLEQAAALATAGASPLPHTVHKMRILCGTVLETLERTTLGCPPRASR
jgi:xanthine dehydrogenase YagS FAD-binding subunit